ncbi:hypothetical protein DEU56DRAFT_175021 [Suillus clintonianus]|uniref:uncharacterized protein n=1 Tax=Suillus clintonianus TaxID=1904413 RepID=UPI001B86A424|nr:uncharacterized protein DEU56DRAFT_175021 [Suillus clintonianus]KAG2115510.1 hypothetical protein DEU56DRAFT_175021 [Suillus clintonianus]
MANLIRSAKYSLFWDHNELMAYNINFTTIPAHQFFPQGTDIPLTVAGFDPELATAKMSSYAHVSRTTLKLLVYLHFAMDPSHALYESTIISLTCVVFDILGFQNDWQYLLKPHIIPLLICNDVNKSAWLSVCELDQSNLLLVLLQVKPSMGESNVEARTVAGAIAAYQYNNKKRQEMGLHPLDAMTMPCMTMVGTRPAFYLVPVTKALNEAVVSGQFPSDRTEVLKCEVQSDHNGGLEAPEYRGVALQYFVAFKSLAKSHWEKFLS